MTRGEEKVQESIVRLNREGITSTAESSSEAATGELESPKSEGYATAGYDFKECIGPSESTSNDLYKMILSVQNSQNTWSKNWTTSSAFTTKPTKWRSRFHLSKKRIATFKPENHSSTEELLRRDGTCAEQNWIVYERQPALLYPAHSYTATIHYSQHAWYIFNLLNRNFRDLSAVAPSQSPPFIPRAAIPLNPDTVDVSEVQALS
jgi:hypothetical protein